VHEKSKSQKSKTRTSVSNNAGCHFFAMLVQDLFIKGPVR